MCVLVVLLCVLFFLFKQKTAYEMLRSLVGSEMCIRDSTTTSQEVIDYCLQVASLSEGRIRVEYIARTAQGLSLIHI